MREVGLRIVLAGALLAACSPERPVSAPPSPAASEPSTQYSGAVDLPSLLFNEVPPDYVAVPEETKPLTLDDVVSGSDDPASERARLEAHGFVRGYSRSWTTQSGSGDVILAFVYEFETAQGAQADAESGRSDGKDEKDKFFTVAGVDGATGLNKSGTKGNEGQSFFAVFFVRGSRLYLVAVGGPSKHTEQEAIDLAHKMDARAA